MVNDSLVDHLILDENHILYDFHCNPSFTCKHPYVVSSVFLISEFPYPYGNFEKGKLL